MHGDYQKREPAYNSRQLATLIPTRKPSSRLKKKDQTFSSISTDEMLDLKNSGRLDKLIQEANCRFAGFYFTTIILLALISIFYGVRAFTDSTDCYSKTDLTYNITNWFDASFMESFCLNVVCFCYYAFMSPFVRKRRIESGISAAETDPVVDKLANPLINCIAIALEVFLSVTTIVSVGLSALLLYSDMGNYCTSVTNELQSEGNWLFWLSFAQIIILLMIVLWSKKIYNND